MTLNLKKQLDAIKKQLSEINNQDDLISQLQQHSSFVCQSEFLADYLKETDLIIKYLNLAENESDTYRQLEDKLVSHISIYSRFSQISIPKIKDIEPEFQTLLAKQHQQLAQYRQYLMQFDDKIRQFDQTTNAESTYQTLLKRRGNCLKAINALEEKITKREKFNKSNQFVSY